MVSLGAIYESRNLYVRREQRTFKNGARKDSLELAHWVKANSDSESGKVENITSLWYPDIVPSI